MKNTNSGRDQTLTLLLILFVALKLTGVIGWSWWWVLSPIWMPLLFILVVVGPIYLVNRRR